MRNENEMATNVATAAGEPHDEGQDEGEAESASGRSGSSKTPVPYAAPVPRTGPGGFFTIYKRGQGKWTRLGTVFVGLLLAVLTAFSLYQNIIPYLPVSSNPQHDRSVRQILLSCCVGFFVVFALLIFWQTNKPRNVDFLIATDSEMKKVNWTTRGQLLGSTRVVVLFLFFIAIFLSVVDLAFYGLFHLIGVLQ
jgi:preprotein translocase SecE subunit